MSGKQIKNTTPKKEWTAQTKPWCNPRNTPVLCAASPTWKPLEYTEILFLFLLQVIMRQNLSPSQQILVPSAIPLEKDAFQISYMEKVDTEDLSLYKEHFSSSLLAEKGKWREMRREMIYSSFKTFLRITINIFQYTNKPNHVLPWKVLFW